MAKGISGNVGNGMNDLFKVVEVYNKPNLTGTDLDNRIYELQQRTDLTKRQQELLHYADVAYLQDREDDSNVYVNHIEAIGMLGYDPDELIGTMEDEIALNALSRDIQDILDDLLK